MFSIFSFPRQKDHPLPILPQLSSQVGWEREIFKLLFCPIKVKVLSHHLSVLITTTGEVLFLHFLLNPPPQIITFIFRTIRMETKVETSIYACDRFVPWSAVFMTYSQRHCALHLQEDPYLFDMLIAAGFDLCVQYRNFSLHFSMEFFLDTI